MTESRRSVELPEVMRVALLCRPAAADEAVASWRDLVATEGAGGGGAAEGFPKSVPDWESCGACWVSVDELSSLNADDYRSPDPPRLFPRVASGELRHASLQTPAWQALEAALVLLTRGDRDGPNALRAAWAGVRETYAEQLA